MYNKENTMFLAGFFLRFFFPPFISPDDLAIKHTFYLRVPEFRMN